MIEGKILLLGGGGMLGRDLGHEFLLAGADVITVDRSVCDIRNEENVCRLIGDIRPSTVINCAAYTNVDGAETHRDEAFAVNAIGAANVAKAAETVGARCLYISTDYVFDGTANKPYQIDSATDPVNVYGASKLEGERLTMEQCNQATVLRTSWLYGKHGKNFVETMLSLARQKRDLRVINDQVGSPTYTVHLSRLVLEWAGNPVRGILHGTGQGACTWYEFAQTIFDLSGTHPPSLTPVDTAAFPTAARRPGYSVLDHGSLTDAGYQLLPPWQDGLKAYLAPGQGVHHSLTQ